MSDVFADRRDRRDAAHALATARARDEAAAALARMRDAGFRFHVSDADLRAIVDGSPVVYVAPTTRGDRV